MIHIQSVFIGLLSILMLHPHLARASLQDAQVRLMADEKSILYEGVLDALAIVKVENLIVSHPAKITRLVINSGGGDVNLGMDLAELVLENRLHVVVSGVCGSSCANYVFPAGKTKRIMRDAVVVWHGSAIQEGIEQPPALEELEFPAGMTLSMDEKRELFKDILERHPQYIAAIKSRQERLYKRLGVDERVTVMGQQLNVAQEWTLLPEDMARFGIVNVTAQADYGLSMPQSITSRGVKLLRLVDYPAYMARP